MPSRKPRPATVPPDPPWVIVDGVRWLVCPVAGPDCARVSAALGQQWAEDVIARHIELNHQAWR